MEAHFTWFNLLLEKFGISHEYVPVACSIFATIIIVLLCIAGRVALGSGEKAIEPAGRFSLKGAFEAFTEMMVSMTDMVLGHHGRVYLPMFGAIFFYILVNNLIGLLPGFAAATSNINATLALGLFSFIAYNAIGFAHSGIHYAKHYMGPVWWLVPLLLPIELISNFVRPFSLGIRLSVNMTADHAVLGTFIDLTKVIIPVIFYGMGTFISLVQAFVFTVLSMVYVMMATADSH